MIRYKRAASQDSDDGAHISSASQRLTPTAGDHEEAQPSGASSPASRHHQPAAGHQQPTQTPGAGHLEPTRRRRYLLVLGFSLASALVGLILLLVWMLEYRPVTGFGVVKKDQLANLHPMLMYTFMVSLNMYTVLLYRTHYSAPKQKLKLAHAGLALVNMLMSLAGVFAMYRAHVLGNMANFYSLHSWIGAATNFFFAAQFLFGLVAFLRPGLGASRRAALMPWHRLAGAAILVLAGIAAITGIAEMVIFQNENGQYQKFTAITFIANFAGVAVLLVTGASIYLLSAPEYLRPKRHDEAAPMKR